MASSLFSLLGDGEEDEGVEAGVRILEVATMAIAEAEDTVGAEVRRFDNVDTLAGMTDEDIITTAVGCGLLGSLDTVK